MKAKECFDNIKKSKHNMTPEFLEKLQKNTQGMLDKSFAIGQNYATKKLLFALDVISKEKRLLDLGIDTFVYRDDVQQFVEMVKDKDIKIIELFNYEREIPDEIAEIVQNLKEEKIFDEYFVVFTDYTKKTEKRVQKERDPILFGVFLDKVNLSDRFYYIGDWEDEHCDLTLQKMVDIVAKKTNKDITHKTFASTNPAEIKEYMKQLDAKDDTFIINKEEKSFFKNVKIKVKKWMRM